MTRSDKIVKINLPYYLKHELKWIGVELAFLLKQFDSKTLKLMNEGSLFLFC